MNIAFIVGEFPKLSETFILDQIAGLLDMGHDVKIFAGVRLKENEVHPSVIKYNLLNKTYYPDYFIPKNKLKRIFQAVNLLLRHLRKDGRKMIKTLNIIKYRKQALGFTYLLYLSYFLKNKFDIIHAHFGRNGLRTLFLKDILGLRLITTFHGYDVSYSIQREGRTIYNDLFNRGDLFTYNSEATRNKLLELNCPDDLMVKLPMGINMDKFTFKKKMPNPDGSINILSVGRLIEMKGREYAIKAVAKVVKEYPNVYYYIVGNGPLKEKLKNLIKSMHLENNIKILDLISNDLLSNLYNTSHIFLHTSVKAIDGNEEGQGVVLLEAQACGMPVIATRHSALPESIVEGKSGFLVPEKDVDAIVEKIKYLIKNYDKWPEMGKIGREFVEDKFDIKKLNKKLVNIYGEICLKSA